MFARRMCDWQVDNMGETGGVSMVSLVHGRLEFWLEQAIEAKKRSSASMSHETDREMGALILKLQDIPECEAVFERLEDRSK